MPIGNREISVNLLLVDKWEELSILALDDLSHGLVHEVRGFVKLGAVLTEGLLSPFTSGLAL